MLNRFLSAFVTALAASKVMATPLAYPLPFDHVALGHCFANTNSFVRNTLGESALADPNIISTKKGSWVWIVDQTASKNYTWYLLKSRKSEICFRVFVPTANFVRFKLKNGVSLVEAFIAPEADFPAKLIEFRRNAESLSFHPTHCYLLETSPSPKAPKRKSIPCEQILE